LAVKIFTLLLLAGAARLFYLWGRQRTAAEPALLATGLLLLSPLLLAQVDSLAPGVYVLMAFAAGAWLNQAYRARPLPLGSNYFIQLLICAFGVSLHPVGLAYPLALLWTWYKEPLDEKQKKYFLVGVSLVSLLTLIIRMGWHDAEWLHNPLDSLASTIIGTSIEDEMTPARWAAGSIVLCMLVPTLLMQWRNLLTDFTGRLLLLGLILGCATFDATWAIIALTIILYFGLPSLLYDQQLAGNSSLQHGIAWLTITALCTSFMYADKQHYELHQNGILSERDQLIKTLSDEAENIRKAKEENSAAISPRLRVASQWPSRTMIACQCDTLPLPPAAQDSQSQLDMMRGITYVLFDPKLPANMLLSRNFSQLGDATETIALQRQRDGVLLRIKDTSPPTPPPK
jgi:hypothetical protein